MGDPTPSEVAQSPNSDSETLICLIPKSPPTREMDPPLILFLAKHTWRADTQLPLGLLQGMSKVGKLPEANSISRRNLAASFTATGHREDLRRRNRRLVNPTTRSNNDVITQKSWDVSRAGFAKGRISRPEPPTANAGRDDVLSPRFCISEQHGLQKHRYRLIGDLAMSHFSLPVGAGDAYFPHDLDAIVAMGRLQSKHGASDMRIWPADFSNAYKIHILHVDSEEDPYVGFTNSANTRPYKAWILAQPGGRMRAPSSCGRVVALIQFLALELLSLDVGAYADASGPWASKQLCDLLGFSTSTKKVHRVRAVWY